MSFAHECTFETILEFLDEDFSICRIRKVDDEGSKFYVEKAPIWSLKGRLLIGDIPPL